MSSRTQSKSDGPTTAEGVAGQKPDKPDEGEVTLTVGQLKDEHWQGLGTVEGRRIARHEVHGAFAGVSDHTEVSIKEATARVREWLKAEDATEAASS